MEGLRISYVSLSYAPDFGVSDAITLAEECSYDLGSSGQSTNNIATSDPASDSIGRTPIFA